MKNTISPPSDIAPERLTPPFYFFSDTHISTHHGDEQEYRLQGVIACLNEIKTTGGTLFILGDFFDFWFDCRNHVPKALKPVVNTLADLRKNGIEIHYIGGNHDYWIKGYLTQELGIHFYPETMIFSYQNTRFYCLHGDQVVYSHPSYPHIRKFLRAPLAIALLKCLPVKWIYTLGEHVSHYNRALQHIPRVPDPMIKKLQHFLLEKLQQGYDIAISGHVHKPHCKEDHGKTMVILGDWIHHHTYGIWDTSGFRLIHYKR